MKKGTQLCHFCFGFPSQIEVNSQSVCVGRGWGGVGTGVVPLGISFSLKKTSFWKKDSVVLGGIRKLIKFIFLCKNDGKYRRYSYT